MGARIFSVKVIGASAAVLSAAVVLRLAAPALAEFLAADAPRVYGSVTTWLTPPYLYFIVNGIIISIAASSRFKMPVGASQPALDPIHSNPLSPLSAEEDLPLPAEYISKVSGDAYFRPEFLAPAPAEVIIPSAAMAKPEPDAEAEEEEFVISRSNWSPRRSDSSETLPQIYANVAGSGLPAEKPPLSARLGRRRSIKASPEGKALGVARPRKHETLESTWRTITDGRPVPLARHLKKSDTWESHARAGADPVPMPPAMHKLQTFAHRSSASPSSSGGGSPLSAGKLRREPSVGQDDLNRRVEAFIKKFNEEMRLQRQQSLQQYMDMIGRGSH